MNSNSVVTDPNWKIIIENMTKPLLSTVNEALSAGGDSISVQFMPALALNYFPNVSFINLIKRYSDGALLEKVISEELKGEKVTRKIDSEKIILFKDDAPVLYLLSTNTNSLTDILGDHYDPLESASSGSFMSEAISNLYSKYPNLRLKYSLDQGLLDLLVNSESEAINFKDNKLRVNFPAFVNLTMAMLDLPKSKELIKYDGAGFEVDIGKGYELLDNNLPAYVLLNSYRDGISVVKKNFKEDPAVIFKPNGKSALQVYRINGLK